AKRGFYSHSRDKAGRGGPCAGPQKRFGPYFPDYDYAYVSSVPPAKKGYAGTISFYKKGAAVKADFPKIGAPDTMDSEGRIVTLETDAFYFVQVYTPNSGDGLKRLGERQAWDKKYADYLSALDAKKPVIACGDFNVAHTEIDLANPDSNHFSAGFTDEERAGFTALLGRGFVDTFRKVHGEVKGAYSWWSQRITTAKANNAGWRIDYFLTSERIVPKVSRSEIMDSGARPDHAPLLMEIDL
ncbi:MAG: exodeoxyribonuclease III, partial [Treponema sp.]|nr:exodeoxyribonuclease III [Treponema sp.]